MVVDPGPRGTPAGRPVRQRNPRGQGARLRDELVTAAAELLERTGSEESITLRAVARQAGVSAPSIVPHFRDSAEIIDAAVAAELAVLHRAIAEADAANGDPVERLLAMARAYVAYGRANPGRYRVLFNRRILAVWDDEQRAMATTFPLMRATLTLVVNAVQACIDAGASAGTDASFDTTVLWFAIHGLVSIPQAITSMPWPDDDELLTACVTRAVGLRDRGR